MTSPWAIAMSALFVWWFSTGAILWRVKRADQAGGAAHLWSVILGLPLLVGGAWGVHLTLDDQTVTGVYVAFLSALAIWGYIELAFLSGVVTGPNRAPCPTGIGEPERFLRAVATIAWHEMALVAALVLIWVLSDGALNVTALGTFAVLFFARISAKLNLFFGVPRIHTEFLPKPLVHLVSHFRIAPMNWVFPISITALSFAAAIGIEHAFAATSDAAFVSHVLLSALIALALLEHWFMVLPLPDQKLWRWLLPRTTPTAFAQPTTGPALAEPGHTRRK